MIHSAICLRKYGKLDDRKYHTFLTGFLIELIRVYQCVFSPMIGPACRYYPSCSEYACQALERYGACKGLWLAAKRILRCHPFHPGGFDPVP